MMKIYPESVWLYRFGMDDQSGTTAPIFILVRVWIMGLITIVWSHSTLSSGQNVEKATENDKK